MTTGRWPAQWPFLPGAAPAAIGRGMVASTDRYATEVGTAVLANGGNAVDAAVAVCLALAVVNPEAGNLGGSGFLLAVMADGRTSALDYRSVAPGAATREMFVDDDGQLSKQSQLGPLAAATPGSVRGLWEAHRTLGERPWAELVEPAIELARGFSVTERFARSYPPHIVDGLERFSESRRIFLPDGRPPRPGETFRQPELAATLERIRDRGADGFYEGETAALLADAMRRDGGLVTEADLSAYRVARREALGFSYRGSTILSMPPSSSGGVTLAEIAHILARRDLSSLEWHGAEHVHLLAEAWKRAFADRNHFLADTDFADVPVAHLASAEYGAARGREIGDRATEARAVRPGLVPGRRGFETAPPGAADSDGAPTRRSEGHHTTHVSVVDPAGNAVSTTTTVNTWYGSKWVAEGTGVLLNNDMDDFTAKPGAPNHFGLVQGEANAIEPGKRMVSTMTPTIVLDRDGAPRLVVGAPGGATIITSVFQVISNIVDHGMELSDAVSAPRVHHQHLPDRIDVEPHGLPRDVAEALRGMGHVVLEKPEPWGDVQAVLIRGDGTLEGVSDPRRGGVALGV